MRLFSIREIDNKREVKWRKMWKILYHVLTGRNPNDGNMVMFFK